MANVHFVSHSWIDTTKSSLNNKCWRVHSLWYNRYDVSSYNGYSKTKLINKNQLCFHDMTTLVSLFLNCSQFKLFESCTLFCARVNPILNSQESVLGLPAANWTMSNDVSVVACDKEFICWNCFIHVFKEKLRFSERRKSISCNCFIHQFEFYFFYFLRFSNRTIQTIWIVQLGWNKNCSQIQ